MNNFDEIVAYKTLNLLNERKAMLYQDGTAFYVWQLPGRLVIVFDPDEITVGRVDDDFAHVLSSRLSGRRVVRTNSRGVFLQIGRDIPPAPLDLTEQPLDLTRQPTPLSIPVGVTGSGALWLDLVEADSILLTGSRGMGKTGMLHGWIQALLNGGQADVLAWDGKDWSEFGRYADRPGFRLINLETSLRELLAETDRRRSLLLSSGHTNAVRYGEEMRPIALIVDEAALVPEQARPLLVQLVERCRDTGVHPIFGTNNPHQSSLIVKSNLVTRISLAVPALAASVMALGMSGAEKLPKLQGRGLIERQARLVEFQAFRVTYPTPSEEALRIVAEASAVPADETAQRIRALHAEGKSPTAIVRELYNLTGGREWSRRIEEVRTVITTTTTMSLGQENAPTVVR